MSSSPSHSILSGSSGRSSSRSPVRRPKVCFGDPTHRVSRIFHGDPDNWLVKRRAVRALRGGYPRWGRGSGLKSARSGHGVARSGQGRTARDMELAEEELWEEDGAGKMSAREEGAGQKGEEGKGRQRGGEVRGRGGRKERGGEEGGRRERGGEESPACGGEGGRREGGGGGNRGGEGVRERGGGAATARGEGRFRFSGK